MEQEKSILICTPIERMKVAPNSRANCSDCGVIVGITKSTEEAFAKEKHKDYICVDCFEKRPIKSADTFVPLSDGQRKELFNYFKLKNGG